jgi:hypothetical protein
MASWPGHNGSLRASAPAAATPRRSTSCSSARGSRSQAHRSCPVMGSPYVLRRRLDADLPHRFSPLNDSPRRQPRHRRSRQGWPHRRAKENTMKGHVCWVVHLAGRRHRPRRRDVCGLCGGGGDVPLAVELRGDDPRFDGQAVMSVINKSHCVIVSRCSDRAEPQHKIRYHYERLPKCASNACDTRSGIPSVDDEGRSVRFGADTVKHTLRYARIAPMATTRISHAARGSSVASASQHTLAPR